MPKLPPTPKTPKAGSKPGSVRNHKKELQKNLKDSWRKYMIPAASTKATVRSARKIQKTSQKKK